MTDTPPTDESTAPEEVPAAPEPERRHGALVVERFGQTVLYPDRDAYLSLMTTLRDEGFDLCADLCGVDYINHHGRALPVGVTPERFEIVVNLLSLANRTRVRVRVQVPESDPVVASLFRIWPGTEAMEREAWDMFGIGFADHPDLTRILMPQDWEGHPLRKDFAQGRVPVQFKHPNDVSGGVPT